MDKYLKSQTFGTRHVKDILDDPVIITEKLDGSQVGFGKDENGKLHIRSRSQSLTKQADGMFKEAIEQIKSVEHLIPDNTLFYCEYLKKPQHNNLKYGRIPKGHLACFCVVVVRDPLDQWSQDNLFFLDPMMIEYYTLPLGIDVVPFIGSGKFTTKQVKDMVEANHVSALGGAMREGIVIVNIYKSRQLPHILVPYLTAKFVSPEYKEVKNKAIKLSGLDVLKDKYHTTARWEKARQHLTEAGLLAGTIQDIGPMMTEVSVDLESEEKENIKDELWNIFRKEILRSAQKGLVDWYKENYC